MIWLALGFAAIFVLPALFLWFGALIEFIWPEDDACGH